MICFSRQFLRSVRQKLSLEEPSRTLIFGGCNIERIDATFDRDQRVRQLVVKTRQGKPGNVFSIGKES